MKKLESPFLNKLFLLFFINFIVALIMGLNYIKFIEVYQGFFPKLYIIATLYSHFFLITLLPFSISLIFYILFKYKKGTWILFAILNTLFLSILKLDITIFSQFRYHLSPLVFNLIFGKRASDIFQFSISNIIVTILFILGLLLFQILTIFFLNKKEKIKLISLKKPSFIILVLTLVISHFSYAWADVNFYRPITQFRNTLPAFYPLTAEDLLIKMNMVDHEKIKKNKSLALKTKINSISYPKIPIITKPLKKKKNFLIIVIDSWRFDYLTADITPKIKAFSDYSQVFTNHNSGSNMTTGGIFSIFYGLPATYYDSFTGIEKQPVLFTELLKQKYNINIYGSSTIENPPFNRNVFSGIPNLRLNSKGNSPSERDQNITDEWIQKMDLKIEKPFFDFLFYDAAHGFDFPSNYTKKFTPSLEEVDFIGLDENYDPTALINKYKNSLHYIDHLVGKIIFKLKEKELLEDTIVIITSDHGQEFNDNKKGYWQHGGNFSKYQIKVPLIIYDHSLPKNNFNHLTLHYDIVPTIFNNYLGNITPINNFCSGINIFDKNIRRDFFICGYNEKYAIIEKNRITNIYKSGLYDIFDHNLNQKNEELNYGIVEKALKETSRFYNLK